MSNDRRQSDSLEHEELVLKLEARVVESCALRQLLRAEALAATPKQNEKVNHGHTSQR